MVAKVIALYVWDTRSQWPPAEATPAPAVRPTPDPTPEPVDDADAAGVHEVRTI
jgi:hypothetical protein